MDVYKNITRLVPKDCLLADIDQAVKIKVNTNDFSFFFTVFFGVVSLTLNAGSKWAISDQPPMISSPIFYFYDFNGNEIQETHLMNTRSKICYSIQAPIFLFITYNQATFLLCSTEI